jgi:hypothetical protein
MDTSNWDYYDESYIDSYSDSRYNTDVCIDGFYEQSSKEEVSEEIEKEDYVQKHNLLNRVKKAKKYVLDNNIDLKTFKIKSFYDFSLSYLCADSIIQHFLSLNNSEAAFDLFLNIDWDIFNDIYLIEKVEKEKNIKDIIE